MRIPVVVEAIADGRRYRARSSEPFPATVEADTRESALGQISREIEAQMRHREVVYLDVPALQPDAGGPFPLDETDPRMVSYRECLAEARKELEEVLSRTNV